MLEAASLSDDPATSFGIFWAFFSSAACAGGFVTFAFYSTVDADHSSGSLDETDTAPPRGLFYVYTALMLAAAALTACVQGSNHGAADDESSGAPVQPSWREEARHTLMMSFDPRMVRLAPLFFYSGFNQPYQLDTFGNRFFTSRLLGLELVIFYMYSGVAF